MAIREVYNRLANRQFFHFVQFRWAYDAFLTLVIANRYLLLALGVVVPLKSSQLDYQVSRDLRRLIPVDLAPNNQSPDGRHP